MKKTDAPCPHCDQPRGRGIASGEPLLTCGSRECHHAAIRAAVIKKHAEGDVAPKLGQHPWGVKKEIDFQNGFDSQNLTFAEDRSRIRT